MKIVLAVALVTAGILTAQGANAPDLLFESKSLGTPPLRLGDSIAQGSLPLKPLLGERANLAPATARITPNTAPPRHVSRMPVVEPNKNTDYKMIVVSPDPSTDYRMIVKDPGVESVK